MRFAAVVPLAAAAAVAAVTPLRYCAGACENAEEEWVGIVQLVFRMAHIPTQHTRSHTEARPWLVTKRMK